MLHTALLAATSNAGLLVSAQRALEVAALAPASPASGVWLLDMAIEACLVTQAGLVITLAAASGCHPQPGALMALADSAWTLPQYQLQLAADRQLEATWTLSALLGFRQLGAGFSLPRGAEILESCDIWLLGAELAGVSWGVLVVMVGGGLWLRSQVGYDAVVTLCQQRGLSAAEIFSLTTFTIGYLVFDMFVIMAEDDALEAISYLFGGVIGAALVLLALAVDVQYYFMISAISGGEATLRILYTDIVNNGLCLLRVFFCWVRYLFYDLQAELVDFAFHYTETAEESLLEVAPGVRLWADAGLDWTELSALSGAALLVGVDAVAMLVQLLIGGFKLALALFLFWLILDLFLLRTVARAETLGWVLPRLQRPAQIGRRQRRDSRRQ